MPKKPKRKQPLRGERLAWFELASHLHMTVEKLKEEITFSEFLEWNEFLALERNKARKLDFYLAQIAAEVRRTCVKFPEQVRTNNFLLKFASPLEAQMELDADNAEEYREQKVANSKSAWFAALGGFNPEAN